MSLAGAAQDTTLTATVASNELPKETSRGAERNRPDFAKVKSLADQRAEELSKIDSEVSEASMDQSAKARDKALEDLRDATRRQAILIKRGQASRSDPQPDANAGSGGRAACPSPAATALLLASARSGCGRAITPDWTSLSGRNPIARSGVWVVTNAGAAEPAAGRATMSLSSTRMGLTHCWLTCPRFQ